MPDQIFFDTTIYGITEDVSSKTLQITTHKELHEMTLENLKTGFPDKQFNTYRLPLAEELDLEKINRNMGDLMDED